MFVFLIKFPDLCFYNNRVPVTYKVTEKNLLKMSC